MLIPYTSERGAFNTADALLWGSQIKSAKGFTLRSSLTLHLRLTVVQ